MRYKNTDDFGRGKRKQSDSSWWYRVILWAGGGVLDQEHPVGKANGVCRLSSNILA